MTEQKKEISFSFNLTIDYEEELDACDENIWKIFTNACGVGSNKGEHIGIGRNLSLAVLRP